MVKAETSAVSIQIETPINPRCGASNSAQQSKQFQLEVKLICYEV